MNTLDPEVPILAADHLNKHGWTAGWGTHGPGAVGPTCAHGARLSVCGQHPGDQYLWRAIFDQRGLTIGENDGLDGFEVNQKLRSFGEPTEKEMVRAFGPRWRSVRELARQASIATQDQLRQLEASALMVRTKAEGGYRQTQYKVAFFTGGESAYKNSTAAIREVTRLVFVRHSARAPQPTMYTLAVTCAIDALDACLASDSVGCKAFLPISPSGEFEPTRVGNHQSPRTQKGEFVLTWEDVDRILEPWCAAFSDPRAAEEKKE